MHKHSPSESAFSYPRILAGALLCVLGLVFAFTTFREATAQGPTPEAPEIKGVYRGVSPVVRFDVSPALRDMEIIPPGQGKLRENEDRTIMPFKIRFAPEWDPAAQATLAGSGNPSGTEIAGPIVSFDAQPNGAGVSPPDPNGSVGPNHVIAMVNLTFQIFNKTGSSLFGPANNNTLWAGFGGPCQTENAGDPVVLYDRLADRWFLSQFTAAGPNYFFCVAISQTPDPTGAYYRYAISTGTNFPDYPKAGVWPDAYYISTREFAGSAFAGVGAYALNRAQAIAGNPQAQVISFVAPPGATPYNLGDGLLPSDMDGNTPPPAGSANYFVGSMDNNGPYGAPQDALTFWKFTADFTTPGNSSFVLANTIPVAAFNSILGICSGRACIPQPNTTNRLDHLGYRQRPLFRLAYRNFGTHESLVTNQSVSGGSGTSGEVSGVRWWELRNLRGPGAPIVHQEGTFAPGLTDGIHRWMGSIAMDREGNMGLAYSAGNATVFPGIRYTGRFPDSPLGTMPLGEEVIVNGTGSQTGGGSRWGDYTSLSIDPTDDLTFWHVNEYVPTTSATGWRIRVGSFKISSVPTNIIGNGGSSIVNAGPNGVLDPGESVVVSLGARNIGGPGFICTSNLVGTLQTGGGVVSPSGPQSFGAVCSGGAATFRDFSFMVDPALACGSPVTVSLKLTDGATDFGTLTYNFTTGSSQISPLENFDGVTAPALPAGWEGTASGSGVIPVTVTDFPASAPNAVKLSEATTVGLSEVTSAPVMISSASKLSFRNQFNTELNFDGLVLEISIGGGAFQDILAAGGSFVSGGYNSTLPTTFSNPLPSRMAWTGLSGGTAAAPAYITTVVNLPAAAVGQSVRFKWRQGSDSSVAPATNPGSRIDSLTLVNTVCGGSAPTVVSASSRKMHGTAGVFDVPLPLVPLSGAIGTEPRVGPVAGEHTVVVTFINPVTVSGTSVTTGTGTATSTVAGNVVTVNLTGANNLQRLGITLSGVSDGTNLGSIQIPIGLVLGDTNANGSVSNADVSQTKQQAGNTAGSTNFRTDVNASGSISSGDVGLVKSNSGAGLP